jgi:large subunit ribosomal protein L25
MGLINLSVFPRSTTGKNANRRSRAAGRIPAVIYGNDVENQNIELDQHDFMKTMSKISGSSAIFSLTQDGGEDDAIALLKEIQTNPVTDQILHVDLFGIPRGVPVTVAVTLHIVGSNQVVKNGEGSVAQSLTSVDISCRPSELPDFIEVDISELELNDKIFVKDIVSPVGEVVSDAETLVLNIKPPVAIVEEVEEEDEEGVEGAEGEDADGDGDKEPAKED